MQHIFEHVFDTPYLWKHSILKNRCLPPQPPAVLMSSVSSKDNAITVTVKHLKQWGQNGKG